MTPGRHEHDRGKLDRSHHRCRPATTDHRAQLGAVTRRLEHPRTLVIDHPAGVVRGAALMEIGADPVRRGLAEAYLAAASATSAAPSPGSLERELCSRPPALVDMFLRLFFDGGPRDHLDGITAPFVRLGHPAGERGLRLDLTDAGAVVGHVRDAWFDGEQLRGDIHLLPAAPVESWDEIRAALLSLAERRPLAIGISACYLPDPILPAFLDLVRFPGSNRYGLLGSPPVIVETVGRRRHAAFTASHEPWLLAALAGGRTETRRRCRIDAEVPPGRPAAAHRRSFSSAAHVGRLPASELSRFPVDRGGIAQRPRERRGGEGVNSVQGTTLTGGLGPPGRRRFG